MTSHCETEHEQTDGEHIGEPRAWQGRADHDERASEGEDRGHAREPDGRAGQQVFAGRALRLLVATSGSPTSRRPRKARTGVTSSRRAQAFASSTFPRFLSHRRPDDDEPLRRPSPTNITVTKGSIT